MSEILYMALLIPIVLVMMGTENWVSSRKGRRFYHFGDTITNLSCGLGQLALSVYFTVLSFAGYRLVYKRFSLVHFPKGSWITWVLALIGVDFCYYWYHRSGHRINFFWAFHNVHHQSEDLNFGVALRQAWFTDLAGAFFYWPLPLLGVALPQFVASATFLCLYQICMHTNLLKKPGIMGLIFNTPSFHRVHHGSNVRYLDRNLGATLIVWDRLFGSFQEEDEEPRYGIVEPFRSLNPVWAQFHYFFKLAQQLSQTKNPRDKLKLWIMPPGWTPEGFSRQNLSSKPTTAIPPFKTNAALSMQLYIGTQFTGLVLFTLLLLTQSTSLVNPLAFAELTFILGSLLSLGGLLESKRWAVLLEITRHFLALLIFSYAGAMPARFVIFAVAMSEMWFFVLQSKSMIKAVPPQTMIGQREVESSHA